MYWIVHAGFCPFAEASGQLGTERPSGADSGRHSGTANTDIPNLTELFSSLISATQTNIVDNSDDKITNFTSDHSIRNATISNEINSHINNSVSNSTENNLNDIGDLAASGNSNASLIHLTTTPSSVTGSNSTLLLNSTIFTTDSTGLTTPLSLRDFNPSVRIGSSQDDFQPRSGLVEDVYDYATDFGERISSTASADAHRTPSVRPAVPSLYLRDQPEQLVPFDEFGRGSPTVRPSGLPPVEWQPNWPLDLVPTPVIVDRSSLPSETRSSFIYPSPTSVEFPVTKEPITQYFFDLSDVSVQSHSVIGADTSVSSKFFVTELQPSMIVTENPSVTVTPVSEFALNTGIAIDNIYSSAFFPTALPSAIHHTISPLTNTDSPLTDTDSPMTHTDTPTLESFHNSIGENISSLSGDLDEPDVNNQTNESSVQSALSNGHLNRSRPQPEYILGSDSDYLFPTNTRVVEQNLAVSGGAGRPVDPADELSLGAGNLPVLSFALPTAIPSSAATLVSRIQTSVTRNKFASKSRATSAESRKPLWQLLSNKSDLDDVTVSPVLSELMFATDFPVGILSNRIPVQHSTTSVNTVTTLNPSFTSTSISHTISSSSSIITSTTAPSLSISTEEFNALTPTLQSTVNLSPGDIVDIAPTASLVSDHQLISATTKHQTDSAHSVDEWHPLVNEAHTSHSGNDSVTQVIDTNETKVLPVATVVLTGGFTPLIDVTELHSNVHTVSQILTSTSVTVDVAHTIADRDSSAPIVAPTYTLTSAVTTRNRSQLDTALLHNVPDTIVTTFPPTSLSVAFGSTLGEHSRFGLSTTPAADRVYGSVPHEAGSVPHDAGSVPHEAGSVGLPNATPSTIKALTSALLEVTPKSTGSSGIEDTFVRTTPSHSFGPGSRTTNTIVGNVTFRRRPTTYVYPAELLSDTTTENPVTENTIMENTENTVTEHLIELSGRWQVHVVTRTITICQLL